MDIRMGPWKMCFILIGLMMAPLCSGQQVNSGIPGPLILLLSDAPPAPAPTPCTPDAPPPLTWVPGHSIGNAVLGDSYADIKCKMGLPSEIAAQAGYSTTTAEYQNVRLILTFDDTNANGQLNDNETLTNIFADNLYVPINGWYAQQWNYKGIQFGSSLAEAKAVLGQPSSLGDYLWSNQGVWLTFSSKDGGLVWINVFYPY